MLFWHMCQDFDGFWRLLIFIGHFLSHFDLVVDFKCSFVHNIDQKCRRRVSSPGERPSFLSPLSLRAIEVHREGGWRRRRRRRGNEFILRRIGRKFFVWRAISIFSSLLSPRQSFVLDPRGNKERRSRHLGMEIYRMVERGNQWAQGTRGRRWKGGTLWLKTPFVPMIFKKQKFHKGRDLFD